MLMNESPSDLIDQGASVVPGGAAYLCDIERRLAPYVERTEPRLAETSHRGPQVWGG
jgi:hypothetical protein